MANPILVTGAAGRVSAVGRTVHVRPKVFAFYHSHCVEVPQSVQQCG